MKRLLSTVLCLCLLLVLWTAIKPRLIEKLPTVGGLTQGLDSLDSASVANELKQVLSETVSAADEQLRQKLGSLDTGSIKQFLNRSAGMTDEQLRQEIVRIADTYKLTLTDRQIDQLISLCRSLEGLDAETLRIRVVELRGALKRASETREKAEGVLSGVGEVAKSVGDLFYTIGDLF